MKHPRNEESAEEIGGRIIRELLNSPSPPQTLEEDLLETNMRIAQEEEIIPLQLAMEQQKHSLRFRIAAQIERHLQAHPSFTKEQRASRIEAAHAFEKKQIDKLKEHTKKLIENLHTIRERRDAAIRKFCRNRDPKIPPVSSSETPATAPVA